MLMYTGGTTGLPKGVLLDQRAEMLNLYHVAMLFGLDEQHRVPPPDADVPRRHRWAASSASRRPGGTSTFVPMFDPVKVLDVIEAHPGHVDGDGARR